jgi:hypothetical protein
LTTVSVIDDPLPLRDVRLYQSPSRRPGHSTLPTPSERISPASPRM